MRKGLVSLAMTLTMWGGGLSFASAQILIDGFLNETPGVVSPGAPSSFITNDIDGTEIDRQISAQSSGGASILGQVLDDVLIIDSAMPVSGTSTASVTLEYLGFVLDLGSNLYFQMQTDGVNGQVFMGIILNDAILGQASSGSVLAFTTTPTTYSFDLTQFAGYTPGFGGQLNSIQVFLGGADEPIFVQVDSLSFSPVPEPGVGALGALAAGLLAGRRRSRA